MDGILNKLVIEKRTSPLIKVVGVGGGGGNTVNYMYNNSDADISYVVMNTDSHTPSSLIVSYRLIKEYSNKFKLKLVYPEFSDNKLSFREL